MLCLDFVHHSWGAQGGIVNGYYFARFQINFIKQGKDIMSQTLQERVTETKLQELIDRAVHKIKGSKENDICRYIPASVGGYIHHFTMRKMKTENPQELAETIQRYILSPHHPEKVQPKPRAARGSRKRRDQFCLSRNDLERLLQMARATGDKEMVRKLTPPRKDLRSIKKELLASIRRNRVDQDLWNSFVEAAGTPSFQGEAGEE